MSSKRRHAAIARLIELGVPFAQENDALHLTREGGHSHRRIVHVADATGYAVQQALETAAAKHPNITLVPDMVAIDLVTGRHATQLFDQRRGPRPLRLQPQEEARRNADRQGDHPRHRRRGPSLPLFDRAARRDRRRHRDGVARGLPRLQHGVHAVPPDLPLQSAGQELPDHRGGARRGRPAQAPPTPATRFMPKFDKRAELAPRDIVARAIDHEIKRLGLDYVHLDISHREPDFVRAHFPNIYDKLLGARHRHHAGADPGRPGAALHLRRGGRRPPRLHRRAGALCGGRSHPVRACTAPIAWPPTACSNASCSAKRRPSISSPIAIICPTCRDIAAWDESRVTDSDEEVVIAQTWGEIRRFMWNYVGIVRTTKRLERAKHRIDMLRQEVRDYYAHFRVTPDLIELRNLVEVADLIIRSALSRHESRGPALHARLSRPAAGSEGHGARSLAPAVSRRLHILAPDEAPGNHERHEDHAETDVEKVLGEGRRLLAREPLGQAECDSTRSTSRQTRT